jgi:hypothetical protein
MGMQISGESSKHDIEMQTQLRMADMPYEDRVKALRVLLDNLWANKKPGDFVDAVDSVSKWCLGEVVARDD